MTMPELSERIETLRERADTVLALPGGGATPARHRALFDMGRQDLSFARIAEAHTDAVAILAEAGIAARTGELYGVWASDGPQSLVHAVRLRNGEWQLDGLKQYCSGGPFVTSALVTARAGNAVLLFLVPMDHDGIEVLPSTWASPALEDTATGPVSFNAVTVSADSLIGGDNWYLTRPGFWHGAVGPAACWAGGAVALVDAASALKRRDPHSRAHLGALQALAWGFTAILVQAGREIDADPFDSGSSARVRALMVRHLIERGCAEILDRFGRATGPQLLAYDVAVIRQHMALTVYIRQCHAERDLETIPALSV
jgi:alkylation response protein AidB-like acyl-CoA dehydrogenase